MQKLILIALIATLLACQTSCRLVPLKLKAHRVPLDDSAKQQTVLAAFSSSTSKGKAFLPKPAESASSTQAKVLVALSKDNTGKLNTVEAPKGGLSEAEKAAYLEEKKPLPKKL